MDASHAMDTWTANCVAQTGMQNVYDGKDGRRYFWEISRREHDGGAITGSTYRETGEYAHKTGAIRIEGNGDVTRYPTSWPFAKPAPFVVSAFSASWDTLDAASLPPVSGGAHDDDGYPVHWTDAERRCQAEIDANPTIPPTADECRAALAEIAADQLQLDMARAYYRAALAPVSHSDLDLLSRPESLPAEPFGICPECNYSAAASWTVDHCPSCGYEPAEDNAHVSCSHVCQTCYPAAECAAQAERYAANNLAAGNEGAAEYYQVIAAEYRARIPAPTTVELAQSTDGVWIARGDAGQWSVTCGLLVNYGEATSDADVWAKCNVLSGKAWDLIFAADDYGRASIELFSSEANVIRAACASEPGQTLAAVAIVNVAAFLLVLAVLALVIRANLPDGVLSLV